MSSELTRMCASNSITFWRSSRSNPVMTEITRMRTVTPSVTPRIEINVMIDRNVRFGFKYRSARKRLNGRFNSALAWRQIHFNSTMGAYTEVWVAHASRDRELFLPVLISSLRAKLKGDAGATGVASAAGAVTTYFSAWAFSSSSVTNSSAEECVASRSTGPARL